MGVELGWHECVKCSELVFWGSTEAACSGGGTHNFGESTNPKFIGILDPIPELDNLSTLKTVAGWQRCRFCQCMFFMDTPESRMLLAPAPIHLGGGEKAAPVCPAVGGNGKHDGSTGPHYLVPTAFAPNDGSAQWLRAGWKQCNKCSALFLAGRVVGRCVVDGKPHTGTAAPFFVCTERTAKLPLPSKAGPGMDVNLKVDTQTALGWMVVSQCTWTAVNEGRLSLQSKWGEEIAANLDFEMVDGPQCAVRISMGGEKRVEALGIDVKDIQVPPVNLNQTVPCRDEDGTGDPDVEFAPDRNNGVMLDLAFVGKMYPKNNNRVRISLNVPVGGFKDFELETQ